MKNVKIITIILTIILITLVAFGGVYIKTQNRMENKIKAYDFGRELSGGRVIEIKVANLDNEESKPNEEDLTVENYKTVKKTVEERLKNLGAPDYTISLNEENGTIRVELAEDDNTDIYAHFLTASGEVQIKEKDAETVLLSDAMVEKSLYTYSANVEGAYKVFLDLYLTDDGQAKMEELKNNYAVLADEVEEIEATETKKEEETTEGEETTTNTEETTAETEETKKIAVLTIAGTEYDINSIEKDKIRVMIGSESSNTTYVNNYIASASELALLINSGKYPLEYEINTNRFVHSDITEKQIIYFAITIAIVMLLVFVVFTIKYKVNGLLTSISFIGFVSILSLLLRYTNVNISIEGMGAIALTIIINFIINKIMLDKSNDVAYKNLLLKLVPIVIISLVFCFTGWSNLSSFGMIMFWGIVLMAGYNALVTKTLLKLKESK